MSDEQDCPKGTPKEPSSIASELKRIRDSTIEAAHKREFLPQPLFWSLFLTELGKVKAEREQIRAIEEALSKLG